MSVKIVECPRDAMQGWETYIPPRYKVKYLNQLLKVGFDTLDFGSFVSPNLVPQMRDTAKVLKKLRLSKTKTKLLAIVANERGGAEAVHFDEISYLGYPFSISDTFQLHNTGKCIKDSIGTLNALQNLALKYDKKLVAYLSMGFGNPYGDPWDLDVLSEWTERLIDREIKTIALSDTIGIAQVEDIATIYKRLIPQYPQVEFGAHLHSQPERWREKINAAYQAGCRRFDTAVSGLGGCPMAEDELVGNLPTEKVLQYLEEKKIDSSIDTAEFKCAYELSNSVFTEDFNMLIEKPFQAH